MGVCRYIQILILWFIHSFCSFIFDHTTTQWVIIIRISNHPSEFHHRKVPIPSFYIHSHFLIHILILILILSFLRLSAGGTRKGRISTARIPASWIPATRIPASRISPTAWLSSAALPRPGLSSAALRSSIRSASAPAATKFTELWLLGRLVRLSLSLSNFDCWVRSDPALSELTRWPLSAQH